MSNQPTNPMVPPPPGTSGTGATDKNGNPLAVNDKVLLEGWITSIEQNTGNVNVTLMDNSTKVLVPGNTTVKKPKVVVEAPEEVEGAGGTGVTIEK
jgi:hypothetical protein